MAALAACAPAAGETAATPTPALTAVGAANETPAAVGGRATGVASSAVVFGRTDDGAFFHGAADAPVTLIDYSDFL